MWASRLFGGGCGLSGSTGGSRDHRLGAPADRGVIGSAHRRIEGSSVRRTDGSRGHRLDAPADRGVIGSAHRRIEGSSARRTGGSRGHRFGAPADRGVIGSAHRRIEGSSARRTDGSRGHRLGAPTDRGVIGSTHRRIEGSSARPGCHRRSNAVLLCPWAARPQPPPGNGDTRAPPSGAAPFPMSPADRFWMSPDTPAVEEDRRTLEEAVPVAEDCGPGDCRYRVIPQPARLQTTVGSPSQAPSSERKRRRASVVSGHAISMVCRVTGPEASIR